MMALPANPRIWIAAGGTDLRRGFTGLSALVQTKLEQSPFSGHVFVFRGRRGDLIKVLWYDGDGLCLFAKRLERDVSFGRKPRAARCRSLERSCRCCWKVSIGGGRSAPGSRSCRCRYGLEDLHRFLCIQVFSELRLHAILRAWR